MKRGHTAIEYKSKIRNLKKIRPDISISSAVIIGFPGETEKDFNDTVSLIDEIGFDKSFSFIYSKRPGTIASRKMGDTVSKEEKKSRMAEIVSLQKRISLELNTEYKGTKQNVLVENSTDQGLSGRSRLDKLVYLKEFDIQIGDFVEVEIVDSRTWSLTGEVVKKISNEYSEQLIEH